MTSYVVWMIFISGVYPRLNTLGKLGEGLDQKSVWEFQIQLPSKVVDDHFKEVSDEFIYVVLYRLTRDVDYRIIREVIALVETWGTKLI